MLNRTYYSIIVLLTILYQTPVHFHLFTYSTQN